LADADIVIPGRAERREPGIQSKLYPRIWIPDRRHSASKTRVNALMAASGMTEAIAQPCSPRHLGGE
jgi:hypothetical protein